MLEERGFESRHFRQQKLFGAVMILFIALNLVLGMASQPIIKLIEQGLRNFM